ncbi:hypothetical protein B0H17DRAFT_1207470 [Mycena rosella]|uniref:Uncharacterized protein n=1 Tax=Mycena rosella TaxID=1033263 RepID=A0AAD7D2S0_MYCRO|nr:hypothetical protein B0H17DRAFT_1207470 [Mycena rosella]
MMFTSSPLGFSVSASPVSSRDAEVAGRDTVPNASVLPLTVFSVFQTLKVATDAILPGLDSIVIAEGLADSAGSVAPLLTELTDALNTATTSLATPSPGDAGGANEDIATLVASILDGVNTALNKLVPKLGLDGLFTPVDGALTGLLAGLGGILPPVLALVGGMRVIYLNAQPDL